MATKRRTYYAAGKPYKGNLGIDEESGSRVVVKEQSVHSGRTQHEVRLTDFGMQGFGYLMGGGFPTSSVYLMTGNAGAYYPTFVQQALFNAAKEKQKVVYYSAEQSSEDVMQDMATFKWNIDEFIDDGTWVFTRLVPPQLKSIVGSTPEDPREQRLDLLPNNLSTLKDDFLQRTQEGRWSAMSLSYMMKCYPVQEITDLVMFMVNAAHKLGGVHFLLLPGGIHSDNEINALKSLVDGVLNFKFAQGFEQAEGEIEVQKMRRIIPKVMMIRHVVVDNGLEVETTARVG